MDITGAVTRAQLGDRYNKSGHALNGCPSSVLQEVSTLSGYQYYVSDFIKWEGPVVDAAAPGTGGWICTSVDTDTDAAESVDVLDSTQFGVLQVKTNDADNDNTQIQLNGSSFRYVVGKRLWCYARIALEDADDGEFGFGLILETDTDMVNTFPADGIFFEKAETATEADFHVIKNSVDTENTLVTDTFTDAGFFIIGFTVNTDGSVDAYSGTTLANLAKVATVAAGVSSLPDDEDLTLAFQIQTGAAATRYMNIDWVFVAQER